MSKENNWILRYDQFDPDSEGLREALCTLGNGYFATRGAYLDCESDDVHYPGTYLAGCYNRLQTEVSGKVIENEDLVNVPNWLPLNFRIDDGDWISLKAVKVLQFSQELNMKEGILRRQIRFQDAKNQETLVSEERFVSMKNKHLAAYRYSITPINWAGKVEIKASIDGTVKNLGVKRYRQLNHEHLKPIEQSILDHGYLFLKMMTTQSEAVIAMSAKTTVSHHADKIRTPSETEVVQGRVSGFYILNVEMGNKIEVEKIISIYTSKDHAISEPGLEAKEEILRAGSYEEMKKKHITAWYVLWDRFAIDLELNTPYSVKSPLMILRLHIFHLLQTVSPHTIELDVGVPARGWHGEAYRGHIFWDELFIFPTLNIRMPEITNNLLRYRYRRLSQAKIAARAQGYKGAMFPWQSSSNGREESQLIHLNPKSGRWVDDNSRIQRHVNLAIAYNVWRYFEATENIDFLYQEGAELLIEITKFWASICEFDAAKGRYVINGIMGPDEYHDGYPGSEKAGIDNNSYTNVMVVWLMCKVLELMGMFPEKIGDEIKEMLEVTDEDVSLWEDISQKMFIPYHEGDVISQFEGYGELKELNWEYYRKKYGDIQRLDRILEAEGDTPNAYKLSKQADVLMLFYLFSFEELQYLFEKMGYSLKQEDIPRYIDYYTERTSNGSTLSRIVHSWVYMRAKRAGSWNLFLEALESDLLDIQGGTTKEGIHLGAMAGTVDIIQRCYTGLETRDNILWFKPRLPEELKKLCLNLNYRGHALELELTKEFLLIASQKGMAPPIHIGVEGEVFKVTTGQSKIFQLANKVSNKI